MTNTNNNLPQLFIHHIFAAIFGERGQDNKIGKLISMSDSVNRLYETTYSTYPFLLQRFVTLHEMNQIGEGKVWNHKQLFCGKYSAPRVYMVIAVVLQTSRTTRAGRSI